MKTHSSQRPSIFRVRLRTLFVLLTVAAIASALAVDQIKRAQIQAKNIRLLRKADTRILFDFEVAPNSNEGRLRRYLRRKYGPDYVCSVHSIHTAIRGPLHDGIPFHGHTAAEVLSAVSQLDSVKRLTIGGQTSVKITDNDLLGIAQLTNLEHLEIRLNGVSESSLELFGTLKHLKYLDISKVPISQGRLNELAKLNKLQTLRIRNTLSSRLVPKIASTDFVTIADAGAVALGNMPRLQTLEEVEYRLTEAGLTELSNCRELRELDLTRSDISDASAESLARIAGLRKLLLSGTKVSDKTVNSLHGLVNLEVLSLAGTQVTDQCTTAISRLPKLSELYVSRTAISDSGVAIIQRSRSLRVIDVGQCVRVTDVSIRPLSSMPLTALNTMGTSVSGTGRAKLKLEIPTLKSLR